jgi:hypothetical protein
MDAAKVKSQTPVQPAMRANSKPAPNEQAQNRQAEPKPVQEAKPRPTVNSQGQTIGKRLNVTA